MKKLGQTQTLFAVSLFHIKEDHKNMKYTP